MSDLTKQIVKQEIEAQGHPSLRKFSDWLIDGFSREGEQTLSHVAIMKWLKGTPPNTDFLQDMLSVYSVTDRRFQFALKLLSAKSPHVWGFGGIVWELHKLPKAE